MIPKFRVWDKEWRTMKVVYGLAFNNESELYGIQVLDDDIAFIVTNCPDDYFLMQSTGLKDKNGVEIFEGDILKINRYDTWYGHVQYFDKYDCPAFDVEPPKGYHYDSNVISHELACGLIEVVGNIYRNPVYSTEDGII